MALMWGVDRSGIASGGTAISAESSDAFEGGEWADAAAAVPVSSKDPMWGKRTAAVTIVEYSDFQ
jgi:hypothetical protein